ncbi:hypothetical protein RDI58_014549 [Solanum bulbocastanum]|uniref:Uncharacterized protein n=1 Tax=Solanum bulbocastanum TaxID=147425 RepID=A0AAN8YAP5_SOLBU
MTLGPESQVLTMNKYCVNDFKFQTKEVSRNKKTNNSGVYIQGDVDDSSQTIEYYGVIQEIIEVRYLGWPKMKIFDPSHRGTKVDHQHNIIEVKHTRKYRSYAFSNLPQLSAMRLGDSSSEQSDVMASTPLLTQRFMHPTVSPSSTTTPSATPHDTMSALAPSQKDRLDRIFGKI